MSKETNQPTYFTDNHAVGMTLRDYFAAKAMQGIQSRVNWQLKDVAELAYKQADEMMKVREL